MKNQLFYLVAVFVLAQGKEENECDLKTKNKMEPSECCKSAADTELLKKEAIEKCVEKLPPPKKLLEQKKEQVSEDDPELKNYGACMTECLFLESGFVKDNTINRDATKKAFLAMNGNFTTMLSKKVDKCADLIENMDRSNLKCKSGAGEFSRCLSREWFLNCPDAYWNNDTACDELKLQVTKCPQLY